MSAALQTYRDYGEIRLEICLLPVYQPELFLHVLLFGDSGVFICAEEETQLYSFQSDFNVSCATLKSTFKSILSPFLCPLTHREAWFMNPCSPQYFFSPAEETESQVLQAQQCSVQIKQKSSHEIHRKQVRLLILPESKGLSKASISH